MSRTKITCQNINNRYNRYFESIDQYGTIFSNTGSKTSTHQYILPISTDILNSVHMSLSLSLLRRYPFCRELTQA